MSAATVQYVSKKLPVMLTRERRRLAALDVWSLGLILLCTTEAQGQQEPTTALMTPPLSPETAPTMRNSLPEDAWEGSGSSPFTPDFYNSQDHHSLPLHQDSVNTPLLPSLVVSSDPEFFSTSHLVNSTGLHHTQNIESAETETSWFSGGDSSSSQRIPHATSRTPLHLSTEIFDEILPLRSSYFSSISSGSEHASLGNDTKNATSMDHKNLGLMSSTSISSSLNATSFTPVSTDEWSITSASSEHERAQFVSRTVHENYSNTLVLQSSTQVSSIKPSTAHLRTAEMSERPPAIEVSSTPLTTEPVTGEEAGTSTPLTVTTHVFDGDTRETHYTLFLRTKKCPFMFANELQKELSENTFRSANYSTSRWNVLVESCTSHLNVSIRTKGPSSFDNLISQFNTLDRSNISIRVLNRTFYIVHVQKHEDFVANGTTFDSNSTVTITSRDEFPIYVSLGASIVAALVASMILCCVNFCVKQHRKPVASRGAQVHRRFEDYTLTPIPRPSSLYVDYYRGSVLGDHYSTTSAGSITSTPTVEQGVVQPFDTCIVPLEDSEAVPEDVGKRPIVEATGVAHVPNFSFHPNANPMLAHCITTKSDSNERLHPKYQKVVEIKNSGLENPSFQRY